MNFYEDLFTAIQDLGGMQLLRSTFDARRRGGSIPFKGGSSVGRVDFLLFPWNKLMGTTFYFCSFEEVS